MKWLFILLSMLGGSALAFQAGVNGEIGKRVGTIETSFLAYAMGAAALFIFSILLGKGNYSVVWTLPKWEMFIGVLGALYIFIMVLSVPRVGTGTALVAAIMGQVIMGMVLDHFGLFGAKVNPISMDRIIGVALMGGSLYFIL
ncbi:DMT family transporter [Alteribacillus bidgolensis]|uniref:Transporter family-2 protein n=1 Tax=Alteribacillus bidgolensis TaxID=930129 RepID=A0A1G8EC03_9BACI|nr:DMT family transporter [Alteribacillus bidgolensis]SDH67421.1 transporter family-2 protein [Alteribacillus bidgolensis]